MTISITSIPFSTPPARAKNRSTRRSRGARRDAGARGDAGARDLAARDLVARDVLTLDARVDASGERFAPGAFAGPLAPPPGATRAQTGAALDAEWRATDALTFAASSRL